MIIADLEKMEGRVYPAGRRTKNLVGGPSPIQAKNFRLGYVILEPRGGQVPWHHHDQEEVYFIVEGVAEMVIGDERNNIAKGQAVYVPPDVYHQLTNLGDAPLEMMFCYAPAGEVTHWRQELDGTLPRAGVDAPPLPAGSRPQYNGNPEK